MLPKVTTRPRFVASILSAYVSGVSIIPVQVQNWHLNLWPFVIVFALSLKFAKGVATCRKAFEASNDDRVVPEEPEATSSEIALDDTQTSSLKETTPPPAK